MSAPSDSAAPFADPAPPFSRSFVFCAEDDPCACDAAAGFDLYYQEGICYGGGR